MMRFLVIVLLLYVGGYGAFRVMNTERWDQDGRDYVIYPADSKVIYLLWRPLAYLDNLLTGTGSHIGPHREAA